MQIRKSHLICTLVSAAALVAGAAGAEVFEQSVNDALAQDGSIVSQVQAQKIASVQDPEMIEARGGGHNGGHGGNHGGNHGGDHRGPGHEPGHGGHEGHGHSPDWHGHGGGWGDHFHGHFGWGWDAWNRPLWLGWVIWSGVGSCNAWYSGRRSLCYQDCAAEYNACVASGADVGQCNATNVTCTASCNYQYDTVWAPYWGACRW